MGANVRDRAMSGPLRRFRRRPEDGPISEDDGQPTTAVPAVEQPTEVLPAADPATVDGPGVIGAEVDPSAAPEPPDATAGEQDATATPDATPADGDASQTTGTEATEDEQPAGVVPIPEGKLSFRDRGRLRRRLRFLRRVRELGFRDLGGLVFDQHRFGRAEPGLVDGKLGALHAVDHELRAIEHALGESRPITELREPGITACARCGAVHGSEARFCPSCGIGLRGPRVVAEVGDAVSPLGAGTPAPGAPAWAAPHDPPAPPQQ